MRGHGARARVCTRHTDSSGGHSHIAELPGRRRRARREAAPLLAQLHGDLTIGLLSSRHIPFRAIPQLHASSGRRCADKTTVDTGITRPLLPLSPAPAQPVLLSAAPTEPISGFAAPA